MGQGSVRRISLGVFCMAPTQGYHHNQMQVGNVRDPRPSKNGIRIQTEVHLLLDYEKQYWNKRVESVLHLRNTAVRVRSAPQKTPGFRSRGFFLSVVISFFFVFSCKPQYTQHQISINRSEGTSHPVYDLFRSGNKVCNVPERICVIHFNNCVVCKNKDFWSIFMPTVKNSFTNAFSISTKFFNGVHSITTFVPHVKRFLYFFFDYPVKFFLI